MKHVLLLVVAACSLSSRAVAQPEPSPTPDDWLDVLEGRLAPEDLGDVMDERAKERIVVEPPPLAAHVRDLIDADYLTDEERTDLRVFHGVWTVGDLSTPARRARAALIARRLDDPSLTDKGADLLDRAEAAVLSGRFAEALSLLEADESMRGRRLRGESLTALARTDEALEILDDAANLAERRAMDSAPEMVELVRCLRLRQQLRGPEQGGRDDQALLELLGTARTAMDRLYWPAALVEAEILISRDQREQGQEANQEVLAMCPRAASAWAMLGELAASSFNFDAAGEIASRMDTIAGLGEVARGASLEADLVRARAALRQRDAEGAEEAMSWSVRTLPAVPRLLALRAAAAAAQFDERRTDELVARFEAVAPGLPDAMFEVGAALADARQYAQGEDWLRGAIERTPNRAESHIELGLLLMQAGKDDEAFIALTRATELDPFNARAKNSLALVQDLQRFGSVESEHFVVRFEPGTDALLAEEMLDPLERIYARVTGDGLGGIRFEPPGRTIIELMPDQRWFAVRIAGMPQLHTMAASTGPVIALEAPREGPHHLAGEYDWQRVLQHEFCHTVTLERTRYRIPHWFTEAAAVYVEDAPRDEDRCRMLAAALGAGELFAMDEINIAFVRPKKPHHRSLAYAQGHWMYCFLIDQWGAEAPLDLMDRYAQGQTQDRAMREVLGVGERDFLAEFRPWAEAQVREWGLLPPEGVPTLAELVSRDGVQGRPDWSMLRSWLDQYPGHPDVLAVLVDQELADAGGVVGPEHAALLEAYALARPVAELPHRALAQLYLAGKGGTPIDAIEHLEFLDAREQRSAAYASELARRYAGERRFEDAMRSAARATSIAPFDPAQRELAARVAIMTGDLRAAEHHLIALTRIEPDRELHRLRLDALRAKMRGE